MNFDFSESQRAIQDSARRFLDGSSALAGARRVLNGDMSYDRDLWLQISDLGWCGIGVPTEYGGFGDELGYLELCLIAEELGRSLAPVPFSSSSFLAGQAIVRFGTAEQKRGYLPAMVTGERIACAAVSERTGEFLPLNPAVHFDGVGITGKKCAVADGKIADFALVIAQRKSNDKSDFALVLADLRHPTVKREVLASLDGVREHATLHFDQSPAQLLVAGEAARSALEDLLDRAAILYAFEQIGGADACLEMAVAYGREREAFGRKIGSFQALKHKLADLYVRNQIARSNSYYGAWALHTNSEELPLAAALARLSATTAFSQAAKESLHVHGGFGFTWEADCHLYYRRAKQLALVVGSERFWRDRLMTKLLLQESRSAATCEQQENV